MTQILNLYEYTYRWNDAGVEDRKRGEGLVPMLPDGGGYGNQTLLWMEGPSDMPFRRPFGQCFTYFPDRGGSAGGGPHLLCIMRGTIYTEEWISDFRCVWAGARGVCTLSLSCLLLVPCHPCATALTPPYLTYLPYRLKPAEPEEIHGLDLDGFVTSGFFAMLKEVLPQIIAIQRQHNLPEITLAGAS